MATIGTETTRDRDRLFGRLAVEMDFVSRDALRSALDEWEADPTRSLGAVLIERGALAPSRAALLETLVREHPSVRPDPEADPGATLVEAEGDGPSSPGDDPALSPRAIRYTILKHHAKGGLGDVFVARDEELHREVALKEIQERHADRADSRLRFMIEAEITGGLEHPGIVPVYGLGRYPDGRPYYAMRFIRGDTLQDAIDRFHEADLDPARDPGERTLALRGLLGRFIDVCDAIGYAHGRGVLHRDIKPGNIMLGKHGETLVVDWGLAKTVDRPEVDAAPGESPLKAASGGGSAPTLLGSAVGTPQYMSPEQAAGLHGELGPRSDVYSLGATLYSLLTGHTPFLDPLVSVVLAEVQSGDFPPPRMANPRVPAPLEAICLKAMALAAAGRYPTTRALADDLEHWLADEPVSAYREPLRLRAVRWARRHRTLVAGLGAIVLTGVAALGVSHVLIARERDRTEVARGEAEANYQNARQTVETMLDELAAIDLADVPLMEPVRRRVMTAALDFYHKYVATRGNDPTLRLDIGRAQVRLGDILEGLGEAGPAEATYRDAIHRLYDLADVVRDDPEARRSLAAAEFGLGLLLKKANRAREADVMLRRSLADRVKAASITGKVADDRRQVASARYHLASLLARQRGRTPEDERTHREALDDQKALLAEPGGATDDLARRDLARNLYNLALLLQDDRPADAEADFREAYAIETALENESPESPSYRWALARTGTRLGDLLAGDPSRRDEAVSFLEGARGRLRRLAADFPKIPEYRQELAAVLDNLSGLAEPSSGRGVPPDKVKAMPDRESPARVPERPRPSIRSSPTATDDLPPGTTQ